MPDVQLGNTIRKLRFEAGEMTQQQLAERVGCTRQTILLLERSRYVPSLLLAWRIARVFERKIEEVFDFPE